MFAIVSVLIVVALSLLIGRIATLALTVTGVPREIARLQARSALTTTGFTTAESESILSHPVRRRIVMALMLVGNIGAAGLIASLIGSFVGVSSMGRGLTRALSLLVGLGLLLLLSRSAWFDRRLSRVISRAVLRRFPDLSVRDHASLLRLHGEYSVSEVLVQPQDWMAGRPLKDLDLPHEGVLVLGIVRADGHFIGAPTGNDAAEAGDVVLLYGRESVITGLDIRRAGSEGEVAHREAMTEHRHVVEVEHEAGSPDDTSRGEGQAR